MSTPPKSCLNTACAAKVAVDARICEECGASTRASGALCENEEKGTYKSCDFGGAKYKWADFNKMVDAFRRAWAKKRREAYASSDDDKIQEYMEKEMAAQQKAGISGMWPEAWEESDVWGESAK